MPMVSRMTTNTMATRRWPVSPAKALASTATTPASEAATTPRGATAERNACSRQFSPERQLASTISRGRPTKARMAATMMPSGHSPARSSRLMPAASSTYTLAMSQAVMDSWNSSTRSRCGKRRLPMAMAMTTMAVRPDSCPSDSAAAKAATAAPMTSSPISRPLSRRTSRVSAHTRNAPAAPMPMPMPSRCSAQPVGPAGSNVSATAICSRKSVSSAPSGSMMTPSLARMSRRRLSTRMERSRGVSTLGPVTHTSAPKRKAARQSKSRNSHAASAPTAGVTTSPSSTTLRTTGASVRSEARRRAAPPSNTISATASTTTTRTSSRNSRVSTRPRPSCPKISPAASRKRGRGMGMRRHTIWPSAAAPAMTAAARRAASTSTEAQSTRARRAPVGC